MPTVRSPASVIYFPKFLLSNQTISAMGVSERSDLMAPERWCSKRPMVMTVRKEEVEKRFQLSKSLLMPHDQSSIINQHFSRNGSKLVFSLAISPSRWKHPQSITSLSGNQFFCSFHFTKSCRKRESRMTPYTGKQTGIMPVALFRSLLNKLSEYQDAIARTLSLKSSLQP